MPYLTALPIETRTGDGLLPVELPEVPVSPGQTMWAIRIDQPADKDLTTPAQQLAVTTDFYVPAAGDDPDRDERGLRLVETSGELVTGEPDPLLADPFEEHPHPPRIVRGVIPQHPYPVVARVRYALTGTATFGLSFATS